MWYLMRNLTLAVLISLLPPPALADSFFDAGTVAYGRNDIPRAIELWDLSSDPRALFMLGNLAKSGKLKNCDPIDCAGGYFYRSGDAGYLPALLELAALRINNGHMEEGVDILKVGARMNDPDARRILQEMGRAVPPPDLYEQAVAKQAQAAMRADPNYQEAARAQAQQQTAAQAQARQDWAEKFIYGMAIGAAMRPMAPAVTNNYVTKSTPPPPPLPPTPRSYRCTPDALSLSLSGYGPSSTCRPQ